MAYLRWGRDSDWYVFWEQTDATTKDQQRLAMWHADIRDRMYGVLYREAREMLDSGDFGRIPGFEERHRSAIDGAVRAFVEDVDLEWERKGATNDAPAPSSDR